MFRKIGAVLVVGILLQACSTRQSDFEEARNTDTIATYKQFLARHPKSEHTEWVEQRIATLEEKKEQKKVEKLEQKSKENEIQFGKLRDYRKQIGVLTDKHFLENDGWTLAKDDGRIGIVGVVKNNQSSEFLLGMLHEQGAGPSVDSKTAQWVKDGEKAANAAVMQGLKENRDYSYLPPQEAYKVLCSLTFAQEEEKKARILSGWLCNEEEI
jgi:hypothetical protein